MRHVERYLFGFFLFASLPVTPGPCFSQCADYENFLYYKGHLNLPHLAHRSDVQDGFLYLTGGTGGLQIVDVSDAQFPKLVTVLDTPGSCQDVVVSGDLAYLADGSNLLIVNVSDPASPTIIGTLPGSASRVDIQSSVVVLLGGGMLSVVDVAIPSSPAFLGSTALPSSGWDVEISGQYAYTGGTGVFHVVDISNPSSPQPVGSFPADGQVFGIDVVGDHAYLADMDGKFGGNWLRVLDITDKSNPICSSCEGVDYFVTDVMVHDGIAYVAGGNFTGVRLFDVSDPAAPVLIHSFFKGGPGRHLCTDGEFLYVADVDPGVHIFDISEPALLSPTGSLSMEGASSVEISGAYAYVCRDGVGFSVVDISDPANPSGAGFLAIDGGRGLEIRGNLAYIARWSGLLLANVVA